MNCANHPETPVAAFCQNCGKPLCTPCLRTVAGVVYCEPCLAARLNPGPAYAATVGSSATGPAFQGGPAAGWTSVPGAGVGTAFAAGAGVGPRYGIDASPALAGFLGFIPGVGAMYNGQFVKAFAHVLIFVVLIGVANHFDPAGLLVAAWVFYQVFDAAQTAIARRDGRPLPDPLGLNDLGQRLGMPAAGGAYVPPAPPFAGSRPVGAPVAQASPQVGAEAYVPYAPPPSPMPGYPTNAGPMPDPSSPEWEAWVQRTATEKAMHDAGFPAAGYTASPSSGGQYQPIPPAAGMPPAGFAGGRPEPVGALVLIGVGMLFLLSTLGVFNFDWVGRGWPILIIALGAGLLIQRVRSTPRTGGGL